MAEMQKVWAVTTGQYSDYSVDLLFTTIELAEAYIASKQTAKWELNEKPECFTLWDSLPGPNELRWVALVIVRDSQVMEHHEFSFEAVPWQDDFDDNESLLVNSFVGTTFRVVRHTKEEAVQRVGEWVSEQISNERVRLGI